MAFPATILSLAAASASNFLSNLFGGTISHTTGLNQIINDLVETETKLGTGSSTPTDDASLEGTGVGTSAWVRNARARVYNNANISVANAPSPFQVLTFNSERYDNDAIHDTVTNNSRLTCKTAGVYSIAGHVFFAGNGTGQRGLQIRVTGTTNAVIASDMRPNTSAGIGTQVSVATQYELAVNDYVELLAYQDSGGPLNILTQANYSPEFEMARIG